MTNPVYALFSVHNNHKTTDLIRFAAGVSRHMPIVASGGTATYLQNNGVSTLPVTELVARSNSARLRRANFGGRLINSIRELFADEMPNPSVIPRLLNGNFVETVTEQILTALDGGEILGHRVVTLQPAVMGPILATEAMIQELENLGMCRIGLVRTSFYPLAEAIKAPGATLESILQQVDIGGPTGIMAAVKGARIPIVRPEDHTEALRYLAGDCSDRRMLLRFQAKAVRAVVDYYGDLAWHLQERAA